MGLRNLMHWNNDNATPARREDPFLSIQREINRTFDRFFDDFSVMGGAGENAPGFHPQLDISETEKAILVNAELPGVNEKDVEISLTREGLVIEGEKKSEHEEKDKNFYRIERSYGSFRRTIPLPGEVDTDKAEAKFEKGLLKITLPKLKPTEETRKKISVKSA